jgi:hypothetical protein
MLQVSTEQRLREKEAQRSMGPLRTPAFGSMLEGVEKVTGKCQITVAIKTAGRTELREQMYAHTKGKERNMAGMVGFRSKPGQDSEWKSHMRHRQSIHTEGCRGTLSQSRPDIISGQEPKVNQRNQGEP